MCFFPPSLSHTPRISLCAPWRYSAPSDCLGSGAPVVCFIDGTQMQLTNKIKLCVSAEPARKNTSCSCEERNHTGWVYMSPQESLQLTAGVFFLTFAHSTEVLCSNHSFSLSLHISKSISISRDRYVHGAVWPEKSTSRQRNVEHIQLCAGPINFRLTFF